MGDSELEDRDIKVRLHETCLKKVDDRIDMILRQMDSIVESRNSETKSSAGDKFETGRAMMQMEEDKAAVQLANANKLRFTLSNLDLKKAATSVDMGNLVQTNQGIYYLSVALGRVLIDRQVYYCVSSASPIGQALLGLKVGASIHFNGKEVVIERIR